MVGEVFAGLQGVNAILNSVKALVDIRDETRRNLAILDITRQLIELQRDVAEADQEKAALTEKVRALEAELLKAKAGSGDLERFELKALGNGATVYMLKPDARGSEPPHWLCPSCYSEGKKSIYQFSVRAGSIGSVYRCARCEGHLTAREQPRWL